MSKNTLADLNDHLFAQLERLGDDEFNTSKLDFEIQRASAINGVAQQIVSNAALLLKARIAADNTLIGDKILPRLLGSSEER